MVSPADARDNSLPDLLLAWYDRNHRVLPWRRTDGRPPDPYRVWLSEIMLQQTTVATVIPYYQAFLEAWPDLAALAAAPLDDVLKAWAGLGYYARARNLHACAQAVAALGGFPATEQGLRALPGIGDYTAAAIAAIAFGEPATPVDGNVERVIARLYAFAEPLPKARGRLKALAAGLTPKHRPGDYAQALMDLGAGLCSPRKPACALCPWTLHCRGRIQGIAETLPAKAPRPARPKRFGVVFWAVRPDGAVLLRRRVEPGLLSGLMEFPSTPWRPEPWDLDEARRSSPVATAWREIPGCVRHVFTHFQLELKVLTGVVREGYRDGGIWSAPDGLDAHALPTLMKKVAALAKGR